MLNNIKLFYVLLNVLGRVSDQMRGQTKQNAKNVCNNMHKYINRISQPNKQGLSISQVKEEKEGLENMGFILSEIFNKAIEANEADKIEKFVEYVREFKI